MGIRRGERSQVVGKITRIGGIEELTSFRFGLGKYPNIRYRCVKCINDSVGLVVKLR